MTISSNYVPVTGVGNGVTVAFSGNWAAISNAYLRVYRQSVLTGVQTLQVEGADYDLVYDASGFTVTFKAGHIPATGELVVIGRQITQDQTNPYSTSQGYQGKVLETSLDKTTGMVQDMNDRINRAPKLAVGSTLNLILPAPIAGHFPIWNGTADQFIDSGLSITDISTGFGSLTAAVTATGINAASAAISEANALGYRNQAQAAAAGFKFKNPVRAATTAALPTVTYANGTLGVGATLTATANGALAAQDGITLTAGQDLLVKNQVAPLQNGIYTVTQLGTGSLPFILTRRIDFDEWNVDVNAASVPVDEGTTQADSVWFCTSNSGGTIGTTAIVWVPFPLFIADGSLLTAKYADASITTLKIADGNVSFAKIAAAALASAADLQAGTASKLVTASLMTVYGQTTVFSQTTGTVVPTGTYTAVVFDTGPYTAVGTQTVDVLSSMQFSVGDNATYGIAVYKNGSLIPGAQQEIASGVTIAQTMQAFAMGVSLANGDTIQTYVFHNAGSNRTTATAKTRQVVKRVN